MAYIDKKTFKPYSEITVSEVEKRSFECDDLIAPIISILNQKGYKTSFCCAGHPYPHYEEMYVLVYEDNFEAISSTFGPFLMEDDFLMDAAVCREVSLREVAEGHQFDESMIDDTRPFSVYYIETDDKLFGSIAYISFEEKYFSDDDIPIGWELMEAEYYDPEKDEFVADKEHSVIEFNFDFKQDVYYFYAQQVATFMSLYNWAKDLPYIDEKTE